MTKYHTKHSFGKKTIPAPYGIFDASATKKDLVQLENKFNKLLEEFETVRDYNLEGIKKEVISSIDDLIAGYRSEVQGHLNAELNKLTHDFQCQLKEAKVNVLKANIDALHQLTFNAVNELCENQEQVSWF